MCAIVRQNGQCSFAFHKSKSRRSINNGNLRFVVPLTHYASVNSKFDTVICTLFAKEACSMNGLNAKNLKKANQNKNNMSRQFKTYTLHVYTIQGLFITFKYLGAG